MEKRCNSLACKSAGKSKKSNSWEILCNGNCTQDDVRKYQVHEDSNIFVITGRKTERII